jgi:site-specific DNA-methyltransferase (adenine-specific)
MTPPAAKLRKPSEAKETVIGDATLVLGDAFERLSCCPDNSFDLAIVDPPYGASTRATWALPTDHGLDTLGGAWELASHDWDLISSSDSFQTTIAWLSQLKRIVKPTGSIWIHSTYHNSGFVNVACQMLGVEIINEVVWFKRNAFPNLSGRRLTASHETLHWVHTGGDQREYRFNYEDVKLAEFEGDNLKAPGKQLRTVWDIPNNKRKNELAFGRHPTQKPLRVSERLMSIAGKPGGSVLVPFMGSGTEVIAALGFGMKPTGIEIDPESFSLAERRVRAACVSHQ